jgi:stage II sporulation protein R
MDGVFMRKINHLLLILLGFWILGGFAGLIRDKMVLKQEIVRLHVVAHSDSDRDQMLKMRVRDDVISYLDSALTDCTDPTQAYDYLSENLTNIQQLAQAALYTLGAEESVTVSLERESFPIRHYDTFSLPSGIYRSLRISIGDAAGKNWWCVVFPSLCVPSSAQELKSVAAGAGFSRELGSTLTGEEGYEVRFFLLDLWGRIENILH